MAKARFRHAKWWGLLLSLFVLGVLLSTVDLLMIRRSDANIEREAEQRLRALALIAASALDVDELSSISEPDDIHSPAFRRVHSLLGRLRMHYADVVWVYVLRREASGEWTMLVDSDFFAFDWDGDGSISRSERASMPGDLYDVGNQGDYLEMARNGSALDMRPQRIEPWGVLVSAFAPIRSGHGRADLVLGLDVRNDDVLARMRAARAMIVGLSAVIGLLLLYTSWVYVRRFEVRRTELQLQAQVQEIKTLFAKFVPELVRRELELNPDTTTLQRKEADVTVMFVDLEGYTRMSERLAGDSIGQLLERYFSRVIEVVQRHRGQVNETAGDGLMVLFEEDAPHGHALDALEAAIEIERVTQEINDSLGPDEEPVRVNIGLNSGRAFVGLNRFVGALGERYTYTATGPTTNIAARVASLAKGGDILVSEASFERVKGHLDCERVGRRSLKNVSQPVMLYRPRGAGRAGRVDPLVAAEEAQRNVSADSKPG
ncbi:MAG: adenylate/guanylate cyclase domain-containing protein [Myxococcota bacterium]|jgi:class 3 adenylate cyclase|nr:adenylate/guanylate cyclase domain-containing protein [Myxococcota bacterium]